MTERLYYADSMLTEFDAVVTNVQERDGAWHVVLDRSAFYPTSGGQPYDTGVLQCTDGMLLRVVDVNVDDAGSVWHTTDAPCAVGQRVHGVIDWARRRDHMEQHGGEHLLAGAIWQLLGGVTIGLHTGREDATIDVTLPDGRVHLTDREIALLEDTVNGHIRDNVPVRCWFPTAEELASLPLRKAPTVQDHVRVVQFGDFEYCACGGTHPPFAGMIGMVKILSVTPARGKARVRFVCGGRALAMFRAAYLTAQRAGVMLSCGMDEVPMGIESLQNRIVEKEKEKNVLAAQLAQHMAQTARDQAVLLPGGERVISLLLPAGDRKMLIECAAGLIREEGTIALCAMPGEKGGFLVAFACARNVDVDMGVLMRACGVRGGGKKDFAQGSAEDTAVLHRALDALKKE